jgi:hypothetical protein
MGVVSLIGALFGATNENPRNPMFEGDRVTVWSGDGGPGSAYLHTIPPPTDAQKQAARDAADAFALIPQTRLPTPEKPPSPFDPTGPSESFPAPPAGNERSPFRALDGTYSDGATGEQLTAANAERWGVPTRWRNRDE